MVKRKSKIIFTIRITPNFGRRSIIAQEFKTRKEAKILLKRILSKGKINPGGVRQTAFRETGPFGGGGINNPRIVKRKVFR